MIFFGPVKDIGYLVSKHKTLDAVDLRLFRPLGLYYAMSVLYEVKLVIMFNQCQYMQLTSANTCNCPLLASLVVEILSDVKRNIEAHTNVLDSSLVDTSCQPCYSPSDIDLDLGLDLLHDVVRRLRRNGYILWVSFTRLE